LSAEPDRPAGISSRACPAAAAADDDLIASGVDIIGRTLATGRPPTVAPYLMSQTLQLLVGHTQCTFSTKTSTFTA